MSEEREIEKWVTMRGMRIPIYKGESKDEALKRRQMASSRDEAKNLNDKTKSEDKVKKKLKEMNVTMKQVTDYIKSNKEAHNEANALMNQGMSFDEASVLAYHYYTAIKKKGK